MIKVPEGLWRKFNSLLDLSGVAAAEHSDYRKWMRYYLDLCRKYGFAFASPESLPPYLAKIESKSQTEAQRRQATEAVRLYYRMLSDSQKRKTGNGDRTTGSVLPERTGKEFGKVDDSPPSKLASTRPESLAVLRHCLSSPADAVQRAFVYARRGPMKSRRTSSVTT